MKKIASIFLMLLCLAGSVQAKAPKTAENNKMEWWQDAKFGMFVHWGPYCLYGGEYMGHNQRRGGAEWIMNRCKIPVREYRAKASTFNPEQFNADSLVLMAKNAGMKYLAFTTKHHDGFAMFKSDASKFNIVDYTPYGRDIVDQVVAACKRHGVKPCFYFSQSQDWCNAGGATARKLMWEGWNNPDSVEIDEFTKANRGAWDPYQVSVSFDEFFHKVSLPQMKELLDRYGNDIGAIFFDTPMGITEQQAKEMMELLKPYPNIVLNDRLRRPDFPGDYKTPEGRIPKAEDIKGVYWETCMNIGSSWGYKSWDKAWKPSKEILRNLLIIASMGGNYLLNVGPDPQGQIPAEPTQCLAEVGKWMEKNGETVYNTRRSNITVDWGVVVRKDDKKNTNLYLCVFERPADGKITVPGKFSGKKASLLADGKPLKVSSKGGVTTVELPADNLDPVATVIKLELKEKLPVEKLISNTEKVFKIVDVD